MALPGGHREIHDTTLLDTAVRETREEIGLDLSRHAELLGALDDVAPIAPIPILVRPYVFALSGTPALTASPEVDEVVWAPLIDLAGGSSAAEYELSRAGQRLRFPGFRVGRHIVWGLTYRVVGMLLGRATFTEAALDRAAPTSG
jgi:8-oxo-dGTP pyrophosphatase MutT (NUDIX family)